MFIFFRDLRNTIIAVVGLPVILIATFAAMTGIHPAITLGAMVAILPAEYLLLRHLEQKGII